MLHNLQHRPVKNITMYGGPDTASVRYFSVPLFELQGEFRAAQTDVRVGERVMSITTQYALRISRWRELYGQRVDQADGGYSYLEVPEQFDHTDESSARLHNIEVVRTSYVIDSVVGNLSKVCWVMVGAQGPSALIAAPFGKVLSRCPLPKRMFSHGIRLHCISKDVAHEIKAEKERHTRF